MCVFSGERANKHRERTDSHPHAPLCNPFSLSSRERERGGTFETRRGAQQLLYTRKKGESSATIERRTDRREEEDEGRKREREKEIRRTARGEWRIINLKGRRYKRERDEKILFGSFRVFPREFATTSPLCAPKSVPPDFSFYKEYIFNNILLLLLLVELGRFFFPSSSSPLLTRWNRTPRHN